MRVLAKKRAAFYAVTVLFIGVGFVFYLLQSNWLKENVRRRMAAAVQSATGGQVEIKAFRLHWHLLAAEMDGFVLHGRESGQEAPLFQADSVRVRLQIASLLRRDVRIASLQIEAPKIHLWLRADGTNNLPDPRQLTLHQLTDQLLRLKLQQVRLDHGLLQINDRRIPVDVTANDITLLYNRNGLRHALQLASPAMDIRWANTQEIAGSLQAGAQLAQDQFTLTKALLRSGDSQIELSGSLRHFAQPVTHWNVQARLDASQLGAALRMENIRSGTISINGSGYRDAHTPFAFTGQMNGEHLSYLARALSLKNVRLKSKLIVNENAVRFPDLDLTGSDLQWKGRAELTNYRKIALHGELTRLDLRTVALAEGVKDVGWSAIAHGPVDADGLIRPRMEDFTVKGSLQLSPANGGPPVTGNLGFAYRQRGNSIELADSKLHLPGTELTIAGVPGANLKLSIDSTDLGGLRPLLPLVRPSLANAPFPVLLRNGGAHFEGSVSGNLKNPQVAGTLALTNFQMQGANWQNLRSSFNVGKSELTLSSLFVQQDFFRGKATGQIALTDWTVGPKSALRLEGQISNLDVKRVTEQYWGRTSFQPTSGLAAGSFDLSGTLSEPIGNLQIEIANFRLDKEHLDSLAANIKLNDGQLQMLNGRGKSGDASVHFSGDYRHESAHWDKGVLSLNAQSNLFSISNLLSLRQSWPGLTAQTKIDGKTTWFVAPGRIQLGGADGSVILRHIAVNQIEYGNLNFYASTQGQMAEGRLEGNFRSSHLSGTAQAQLTSEMFAKAQLQFGQMDLQALTAVLPDYVRSALTGSVRGGVTLEGPLRQWEKMRAAVKLEDLQITSPDIKGAHLILRNSAPIALEAADGIVTVQSMELAGPDTNLSISGVVPFVQNRPMQLKVNGGIDLRIAELFRSDLQSAGEAKLAAVFSGTLMNPTITGTAEFHNGSVFVNGFPNGLSDLNGTLEFNRNRATLQKVTARFGGGTVALGGFMTLGAGHSLLYRLEAAGQDIRIRYASGVSVTSASQLALTGTSQASVLSGTATVSRIIFNPNTDVGSLLASTVGTEQIGEAPNFLSGLQFDIHIDSAPDMQLSTSLSRDVQATVDLQLRGNPKSPVVLGSIEASEGDIRVFGSRYTINRGQISFTNPAKIEPVLDLDLRTQARGINVDITVSGTLSKLNINYRSDPPLQPRDIIALLTVGRAPSINPNTPNARLTSNDVGALQPGANTVLGQAISPNTSRLQKLFGITNIKIDPLVQGITNTSQGRLTLEQQISRQITVTYVTNLSQTSEQIFRLEYALNPQFSLVALRDDNGEFGIDILYKKRFK